MSALTYLVRPFVPPAWLSDLPSAIRNQDVDMVERLISSGEDVVEPRGIYSDNYRATLYRTPLYLAFEARNPVIMEKLLEAGADPNWYPENHRSTLLVDAARAGLIEVVQLLLRHGAEPDKHYDQDTPLRIAISKANLAMVRVLIAGHADLNLHFPLHFAVARGELEIVEELVNAGVPIDILKPQYYTPLGLAASMGNAAIVQQLLLLGANANPAGCTFNNMPLFLGVKSGSSAVVNRLILAGAVLDQRSFLAAITDGHGEIVQQFVEADVEGTLDLRAGIDTAIKFNRPEIARILIGAGARVDAKLLHEAICLDRDRIVPLLTREGVDLNELLPFTFYSNATALHWAVQKGCERLADILLRAGASLEIPAQITRLYYIDSRPQTPLILALQNKNRRMAALLIAAGAGITVDRSSYEFARELAIKAGFEDIAQQLSRGRAS